MSSTVQPLSLRRLIPLALATGLFAGAGAWALKWLVRHLKHLCYTGVHADAGNWQFIIWPVIGVCLTAILARRVFRQQVADACDKLATQLRLKKFRLSPNIIWETIGGCALTVGSGASAGTESPIAYAGAAMGSGLGQIFKMPPATLRVLIACGAGAGIAGIFKAPIGGMFFVFEILRMELSTVSFLALGVACLTAALTAYVMSGLTPDIIFTNPVSPEPVHYLLIAGMAIITGVYCWWYNAGGRRASRVLSHMSPWVKHISSGLTLGLAVFLMPGLFGDGYFVINGLMRGDYAVLLRNGFWALDAGWALVITAVGMLLVKGVLVYLANNGGGVAGDFSPTLFAGCILGWLFAHACNACGFNLPEATFACIAMAAAMSGILQAPMMAIFITVEATQAYSLLLPITVASLISFIVSRALRPGEWGHLKGLRFHEI